MDNSIYNISVPTDILEVRAEGHCWRGSVSLFIVTRANFDSYFQSQKDRFTCGNVFKMFCKVLVNTG